MFKKSQFGIVFNTIFSLFFAGVLTLYIQITQQGGTNFNSFMMALVPAYAINFVLGTYIPLVVVGDKFASIFTKNEKSIVFYLLRMLCIVFIMTALMSILVMFSQMGFTPVLIFAFLGSFPLTFLFAYVCGCLIFPLLFKITMSLCVKEG